MQKAGKDILLTIEAFEDWIFEQKVSRTIKRVQQHHTYRPSYAAFTGYNQLQLVQNMRDYHVHTNGWRDIAQHFTTFPDGTIVASRSMDSRPIGISGVNTGSICIEHLGYFDMGADQMTKAHRETIVKMTALILKRFDLPINKETVIYHHWYDRTTRKRTGGSGNTKTCPGTAFFGGNKEIDAELYFFPHLEASMHSYGGFNLFDTETTPEKDVLSDPITALNDLTETVIEQADNFVSDVAFWKDFSKNERNHLPNWIDHILVFGSITTLIGLGLWIGFK